MWMQICFTCFYVLNCVKWVESMLWLSDTMLATTSRIYWEIKSADQWYHCCAFNDHRGKFTWTIVIQKGFEFWSLFFLVFLIEEFICFILLCFSRDPWWRFPWGHLQQQCGSMGEWSARVELGQIHHFHCKKTICKRCIGPWQTYIEPCLWTPTSAWTIFCHLQNILPPHTRHFLDGRWLVFHRQIMMFLKQVPCRGVGRMLFVETASDRHTCHESRLASWN